MNFRTLCTFSITLWTLYLLPAQSIQIPLNEPVYQTLSNWDIRFGPATNHSITALRVQNRSFVVDYAQHVDSLIGKFISRFDYGELEDVMRAYALRSDLKPAESLSQISFVDSSETFYSQAASTENREATYARNLLSKKPILRYFYRHPAYLVHVEQPSFRLYLNPIIHGKVGSEQGAGRLFENTRGAIVQGVIDDKVYFHSRIFENQSRFASFQNRFIKDFQSIPGNGLYKAYNSDIFNIRDGYDYLNADAHIGFNLTKHIGANLGYGNHFIGNGIRSLFLSDFSNNYFYLRLNTQVWRFHYQNLFGEINSETANSVRGDQLVGKKYFASHYLGIRLTSSLQVGIFESVIFNRDQFEFQYLNPVIFYRSVEHNLGSPDNVLIGLDAQWNILQKVGLYGQLILDEFVLRELLAGDGWWANKIGWQVGIKYPEAFGLPGLFLQLEANSVRPYTYSHRDSLGSYSHFHQALAHPLGANFREWLFHIQYAPHPKWNIQLWNWNAIKGLDPQEDNWGGNILLPSSSRLQDYNNQIGQGLENNIRQWQGRVSYEIFHHVFWDLTVNWRKESAFAADGVWFFRTGLRMNFFKPPNFY